MKFATWNCSGALHKKHQKLLTLDAELMVIQECSKPDIEQLSRSGAWSCWWVGGNPIKKGLGVLVKAPWVVRKAEDLTPKWAGNLVIDGPASIELFPVWACKDDSSTEEYIEQVHLLLDIIEKTPISPFAIVAGDFNSNLIWDRDYKKNHSAAVERFRKLGMKSAYHEYFGISQGAERHATHWHLKKKKPGYHVDYAFLTRPLLSKLRRVVVGRCDGWLSLSDHAPVLVELDL
ncbi:MAG: endonuclease/exonuclease/phosphatase family protein [Candidatus Acidiferrales bacterium]